MPGNSVEVMWKCCWGSWSPPFRKERERMGHPANKIPELFQLAKRNSLQLDAVIDEIIGDQPTKATGSDAPITDEDIPF